MEYHKKTGWNEQSAIREKERVGKKHHTFSTVDVKVNRVLLQILYYSSRVVRWAKMQTGGRQQLIMVQIIAGGECALYNKYRVFPVSVGFVVYGRTVQCV